MVHFIRSGDGLGRVCWSSISAPDGEIGNVMVEVNGDEERRSGGKNDHVRTVDRALTHRLTKIGYEASIEAVVVAVLKRKHCI